jgi:hypothetical protein
MIELTNRLSRGNLFSIQIKRPVLPERYVHFFGFFLDVMLPRKPLTTFFRNTRLLWLWGHSAQHNGGLGKLKGGPKMFQDIDPQ